MFIRIDLVKSLGSNLKIASNSIIGKKDKIEMDSQEFEKYFDVSSTNRVKGMEILTPDVMEILMHYRKVLNENFDIYIYENIMYIRLHIGKMFESKVYTDVSIDKSLVKKYYDILDFTYNLANEMINLIEKN